MITHEKLGPYRLVEELGRGGMAVVYRGVHLETGQVAAIKTVFLPRGNRLAGLRAEVQALKRIQHPGVVRILDSGLDEWLPWYAMELLEGQTLKMYSQNLWRVSMAGDGGESPTILSDITPTALSTDTGTFELDTHAQTPARRAGPGGLPAAVKTRPHAAAGRLPEVLSMVGRFCRPLSYLHGCSIVHRDITPGNLFIRTDGSPVIMDFGLVSRIGDAFGREVIEIGGKALGTVAYMSPEQIRGQFVDARSDLYSLGCILYELLTGRVPFDGGTDNEILGMHLVRVPKAPSEIVDGLPREIEELVMRLLAKQPKDRPGYAHDVASVLSAAGGSDDPVLDRMECEYLYRPQFTGRETLHARFISHLHATKDGSGRCTVVSGGSGMGKTRFAKVIAREATIRGMRVIAGECTPFSTLAGADSARGAPLHAFHRLFVTLADYCQEHGQAAADRLLGKHGKILSAYEPALKFLPGQEQYPEPVELPAQAARRRVLNALRDALAQFAEDRPLLLIIDDLQWADELSLGFLVYLGESFFKQHPIMVLATNRTEAIGDALREVLDRPWIEATVLDPLDEEAVSAIACDMLAVPTLPKEYVDVLARRSAGSPFFVSECLRALVAERYLYRRRGVWQLKAGGHGRMSPESVLPETLLDLIRRRLGRLGAVTREIVEAAAVLGRETDVDLLLQVHGGAKDTASQGLREAIATQIFEEVPDERVRFTHDQLREVTYDGIPPERRRQLHAAAAAAIEGKYQVKSTFTQLYSAMAMHLSHAGNLQQAIDYVDKAGTLALASFANDAAVRAFTEALELDAQIGHQASVLVRTRWLRQRASALIGLGRSAEAIGSALQALELLGWPMPRSKHGMLLGLLGQMARRSVRFIMPSKTIQRAAEERALLLEASRVYQLLVPLFSFTTGNVLQLVYASFSHLSIADMTDSPAEIAHAYINAHVMTGLIPILPLARAYGRHAHAAIRRTDDKVVRSWVYLLSSIFATGVGAWDQAFGHATMAASIAEEIGFLRRWEEAQGVLGIARFLHGDFERAIETSHQRLSDAALRGDTQTQIWASSGLAQVYLILGDKEGALKAAEWAGRCIDKQHGRNEKIFGYGVLAMAYLRNGDHRRAREVAEKGATAIREGRPSAHYCIHPYSCVTEVFLELLEQERCDSLVQRAQVEKLAKDMCAEMRRSAAIYPVHRPRCWLLNGRYAFWQGDERRAKRLLAKSLREARELDMVYDQGLAEAALARTVPLGSAERRQAMLRAHDLFAKVKAGHELRGLEAELTAGAPGAHR